MQGLQNSKHTLQVLLVGFFIVVTNAWFAGYGGIGLGIIRNNLSYFWMFLVISVALWQVRGAKHLLMPEHWRGLLVAVLILVMPLLLNNTGLIGNGWLLLAGLCVAVAFYFALYQLKGLFIQSEYLLYLILASVTLQMLHGSFQVVSNIMVSLNQPQLSIELAPLGVFNQKNLFASFMATGLCLSGYLFCKRIPIPTNLVKPHTFWHLAIAFIASFLIVVSVSRAGYLGALVGVIFLSPYLYKANSKAFLQWLALAMLGALLALQVLDLSLSAEKVLFKGGSRVAIYLTSFNMFLDNPILGSGLGSFESHFFEAFPRLIENGKLPENAYSNNMIHPHNEILLWAVEGGLIAVLGLFAMALAVGKVLFKTAPIKSLALLGLLFPIVLHAMVEMPFYLSTLHLICLVVLVFHMNSSTAQEKYQVKAPVRKLCFLATIVVSFSGALFFVSNAYSVKVMTDFLGERSQSLTKLSKVVHTTGWENEYNAVYLGTLMNVGIQSKNNELLHSYIKWAKDVNSVSPRVEYFQATAVAYHQLGDIEKAKEVVLFINRHSPNNRHLKSWTKGFYSAIEKDLLQNEN